MREINENTFVEVGLVNMDTGEITTTTARQSKKIKYYSIKRLNMKIWEDGLSFALESVCRSNLDIKIFNAIKSSVGSDFKINVNQSRLAERLNTSRNSVALVLKRMRDINFIKSKVRGEYEINPFVVAPKSAKNEDIEAKQFEWSRNGEVPTESSIKAFGKF